VSGPGAVFAQLFTRDPLVREATRAEVAARLTALLPSAGTTMPRVAREWAGRSTGDFQWSDTGGRLQAAVQPVLHRGDTHSVISLECPLDRIDPGRVARFHRELGERLDADFGQLTALGPHDGVLPTMYLSPRDLRRWLPEEWHALYLGPPYVELIGADRIRGAPAATVDRIGSRAFWLGLDPLRPAATESDRRAERARRDAVRDHLGADLFWRPDRRVCRTPRCPVGPGTDGPPTDHRRPGRTPAPTAGTR
jgi:hypothetical protein